MKSQTFELLQNDKVKMLKNPHPLGLEVKIAEQEQVLTSIIISIQKTIFALKGVVHSPEEGLVTVTAGPNQPKNFQLVLSNIRFE